MSLAIATIDPDSVAETYVRQHIRLIRPADSVVLYWEGDGKSLDGIKSLKINPVKGNPVVRRFTQLSNFLRYGFPNVVSQQSRRELESFLKTHNVDCVLAEFGPTGCMISPVCKKLGIPLYVNFHGYDATVMPKRWIIRHAYKQLSKNVAGLICGSNYFASLLVELGFSREQISVVPCGIEVEDFKPTERNGQLIVAVGRLTAKKAPHLTIRAFSKVVQQFPKAKLEVIGDGPLRKQCEAAIDELGLEESVSMLGSRSHEFVKERLSQASLFAQHSVVAENGDKESQGISLVEAMCCGLPVVTTDHNGFSETVLQNETGFLVAEHDVDDMGDRMLEVFSNQELASNMGAAGRQRAMSQFDSKMISEKLRSILSQ